MTTTQDLRALLDEGRCLCSHADTDWQGVASLLDRLDAVRVLADKWAAERDLLGPTFTVAQSHDHARDLRAALDGA